MSLLKIIYEKYNLNIDGGMYGDASLRYRYDDKDVLQDILAELIPYATISEKPGIRLHDADTWKTSTVWPAANTTPAAILTNMLDSIVVKISAHAYTMDFKSRRAVYSFSLQKAEQTIDFWLIHENAPFDNDPSFQACKRVQNRTTGNLHTYGHSVSDYDILADMKLQIA